MRATTSAPVIQVAPGYLANSHARRGISQSDHVRQDTISQSDYFDLIAYPASDDCGETVTCDPLDGDLSVRW